MRNRLGSAAAASCWVLLPLAVLTHAALAALAGAGISTMGSPLPTWFDTRAGTPGRASATAGAGRQWAGGAAGGGGFAGLAGLDTHQQAPGPAFYTERIGRAGVRGPAGRGRGRGGVRRHLRPDPAPDPGQHRPDRGADPSRDQR